MESTTSVCGQTIQSPEVLHRLFQQNVTVPSLERPALPQAKMNNLHQLPHLQRSGTGRWAMRSPALFL